MGASLIAADQIDFKTAYFVIEINAVLNVDSGRRASPSLIAARSDCESEISGLR